jgi:2-methylcitrate dehydratase PrpD
MAEGMMPTTTYELADFVVRTRFADLPAAVRREGPRTFLNWVGCALGGCRHEAVAIAVAAAEEFSGEKRATVLGRGRLLDALNAAFVNCLASSAYAFDDTHLETVTHPTGPVAAVLLALAERACLTGEAFLTALVLGIEMTCRLSTALLVPPARGQVGWYITGVTGGIGAALAAAKVLGLDLQRTIWALGLAAAQAAGFRQTHATMSTGFVPAHAARCGLQAALLAARGFTCSDRILEGPHGFATVFAEAAHLAAATDGLGTRWETLANTYKPYPCGIVIHPVIDACLQLVQEIALPPDAIMRVRLGVHPLCLTLCDRPAPTGGQDAQVSLQHWTAAVLVRRAAGLAEGTNACVRDPAVLAVRARIAAAPDASVGRDGAVVRLELADGRVVEKRVEHCVGSLTRPMTDAELEAKFMGQALQVLPDAAAGALRDLCWRLEALDNVAAIARASYLPQEGPLAS